ELWLEVFHNLPSKTLKDVSLTCPAFRRLTRTLIFAHFDFHPYALRLVARSNPYAFRDPAADSGLLLPPDAVFAAHMARLDFWSSPEIAPLIRSCHV
ncbi:hypothetical protein DFH06DRAFT_916552, partial [Mycena polygramma]